MPRKPLDGVERNTRARRERRFAFPFCHTASAGVWGSAPESAFGGLPPGRPFLRKRAKRGWGAGAATGRGDARARENQPPGSDAQPLAAECPEAYAEGRLEHAVFLSCY